MKIKLILSFCLLIPFLGSASEKHTPYFSKISAPTTQKLPKTLADSGYVAATIILSEIENCGYLIELSDGKKLMPNQIPKAYKKHGLKVWIKFEILKNQPMTSCMSGKSAKIIVIKKRSSKKKRKK